eukprot:8027113-Alexandrium_andersonii.AAC.1
MSTARERRPGARAPNVARAMPSMRRGVLAPSTPGAATATPARGAAAPAWSPSYSPTPTSPTVLPAMPGRASG